MKCRHVRRFTHFIRLSLNMLTIQALQQGRRIVYLFARRRLSRRFACQIARRIARWISYSSTCRLLDQLFGCRIARWKVSWLICGFSHIFRLTMTLLTFYAL